MFTTIIQNMERAEKNGDLCHTNNTCGFLEKDGNLFSL